MATVGLPLARCAGFLLLILAILVFPIPGFGTSGSTTTTLAVTSGGLPVTSLSAGAVATLTATVMSGTNGVQPGTVEFCDAAVNASCTGPAVQGQAQLTTSGTASMKLRLGAGSHSLLAKFMGTNAYSASASSAQSVDVGGASVGVTTTTTVLRASGTSPSWTLTATVNGFPASSVSTFPTGTVHFIDTSNGNVEVGSGMLSSGTVGSGALNFSAVQTTNVGSLPYDIQNGDFNGDGIPDLAVAMDGEASVTVLLGNGDGSFQTPQSIGTSEKTEAIVLGDFNGDGKLDIAAASWYGPVNVLLGNGDGTFQPFKAYSVPSRATGITAGDFNHDGNLDLAIVGNGGSVNVLLGNGDGTFQSQVSYPLPCGSEWDTAIATGDFNSDGNADLLGLEVTCTTGISVLLGNGDGSFQTPSSLPSLGQHRVVVADFNGDGKADLAISTFSNNTVAVYLGNGDGTFQSPKAYLTRQVTEALSAADFNGDGVVDLAVVDIEDNNVAILVGNGDGTFQTAKTFSGVVNWGLTAADLNGDGKPDFVAGSNDQYMNGNDTVTVFLNTSSYATSSSVTVSVSLSGNTGTHQVVASYPGDDNYGSSISASTGLVTSAQIALSATSLSFGDEPVGSSGGSQNVLLTNTGGAAISIGSLRLTGTNATSFATSNLCGTVLAAGASCRIGARFAPTVTGDLTANITLIDNVSGSPQAILLLSGTGITAPTSSLSLSASSLVFGSEPVGSSTGAQNVILTNTGTVEAYISSFTLSGANAASFATSNTCGFSLAAGASCRIGARFVPTVTGPMPAAITITDNATGSPQTISLSGTGITAPTSSLSLSASSLAFGSEPVGSSTGTQNVILTNTGTVEAYISSFTLTGANAVSFATSNTCGFSLAAGASCRIGARFVPTVTGPMSAAITITDNATGSPQTILLSGTGQ